MNPIVWNLMSESPLMHELPIDESPKPPAFGCIVYIRPLDSGGVVARVANLDGLEIQAANEREALGKLVPLFRKTVGAMTENGEKVPFLDPPREKRDDEIKRFLPVHL